MTHDEMVEVILAHKAGRRLELRHRFIDKWRASGDPSWNFYDFEYRIAEPKWRDATIDDLKRKDVKCRVRSFDNEDWCQGVLDGCHVGRPKWIVGGQRYNQCQVVDE